ncbi:hypothetical protein ES332_D11G120100v1 [Gossypium tomentosum]|uniref:Uncharacterized protein n=1 Tax=Gossypium tomentosum TaxID=34277 RepID=A0A5D2IM92_GOSTO|nr:hypothetical protein ES332_D11G120100v1 [Gossypium tomentosum]
MRGSSRGWIGSSDSAARRLSDPTPDLRLRRRGRGLGFATKVQGQPGDVHARTWYGGAAHAGIWFGCSEGQKAAEC